MPEPTSLTRKIVAPLGQRGRHSVALSDAVFEIQSSEPIQFIDLTDAINAHLAEQHIDTGHVTIFSRHTTAAIKINEAEELLLEDFKLMLRRLCPVEDRYHHNDMSRRKPPIAPDERPNAHSHCMHLLLSTSEHIPVIDGHLSLGTWQRVFMVELDGPRTRQVMLRCASYHLNRKVEPFGLMAATGRNGHAVAANLNGLRAK
jgi:secondary thiamine-phosphate synthase enzyme